MRPPIYIHYSTAQEQARTAGQFAGLGKNSKNAGQFSPSHRNSAFRACSRLFPDRERKACVEPGKRPDDKRQAGGGCPAKPSEDVAAIVAIFASIAPRQDLGWFRHRFGPDGLPDRLQHGFD